MLQAAGHRRSVSRWDALSELSSQNQILKTVETFSTSMYKIGERGPVTGRAFPVTEAEPQDTNLLFTRQWINRINFKELILKNPMQAQPGCSRWQPPASHCF